MLLSAVVLSACSHNAPAPVVELASTNSGTAISGRIGFNKNHNKRLVSGSEVYTVRPGDTLFSIAWEHSLDHRRLAELNKLNNNLIYPGQTLRLQSETGDSFFDANSLLQALNREVLNMPVKSVPQTSKNSSGRNRYGKNKAYSNNAKSASRQSTTTRSPSASKKFRAQTAPSFQWIWPVDGKILTTFSNKSNASRGLDIAGSRGQPVRAAAPGQVVYQGNGLRGYGKLVVIKHSNDYLSAYAHNDAIHVSENEVVKAGQRIADVGSSGSARDKLHFEIRYKGKPVDPLNYLPELR